MYDAVRYAHNRRALLDCKTQDERAVRRSEFCAWGVWGDEVPPQKTPRQRSAIAHGLPCASMIYWCAFLRTKCVASYSKAHAEGVRKLTRNTARRFCFSLALRLENKYRAWMGCGALGLTLQPTDIKRTKT